MFWCHSSQRETVKCWREAVGVSPKMVLGFPTKANYETGKINCGILQCVNNYKIFTIIKKYRIKIENKLFLMGTATHLIFIN